MKICARYSLFKARPPDPLLSIIDELTDIGNPVAIHAIGDAATDQVIAALSNVKRARSQRAQRNNGGRSC